MYIAKDKSGTYILSENEPLRMTCHWKSPDNQYLVINAKFGELLYPHLTWKDAPIYIEKKLTDILNII